jgi:hypothetical protein
LDTSHSLNFYDWSTQYSYSGYGGLAVARPFDNFLGPQSVKRQIGRRLKLPPEFQDASAVAGLSISLFQFPPGPRHPQPKGEPAILLRTKHSSHGYPFNSAAVLWPTYDSLVMERQPMSNPPITSSKARLLPLSNNMAHLSWYTLA